ncbi:MAG: hypothetical protein KKE23_01100 [Nanoarchaeota archaeon]|nr:hypothetical protein [Nanoarchaeota archaeon]
MLQFNPDGSLKLTDGQIKQQETEKNSIIITKEQISEKPAKAQIRIRFPNDLQNPQEIINFYHKIDYYQFRSVDHSISQIDGKTFVIKVDKGSFLMYNLLDYITMCFRDKLSNGARFGEGGVLVRGSWAKNLF